jgi:hypothetical protein
MKAFSQRRTTLQSGEMRRASPADANYAVPVNPFEAFKAVCYRFGVERLADELSLKKGTLYNKCDADAESHHQPTLRDVIAITRQTGDHRILDSLDRFFDRASYDASPPELCSDDALLELLLRVGREQGALCHAVHRALEDGKFSAGEFQDIRTEAFDLISQVLAFVQRLEGLVDA